MVWAGPAEDQHLSVIWASPVPGTSTNQHLTVSVATYLIFYHPSDDFSKSKKLSQRYNNYMKQERLNNLMIHKEHTDRKA